MKRLIKLIIMLIVLISLMVVPLEVLAWWGTSGVSPDSDSSAILSSGDCGENLVYELRESGNLYISGTGPMCDYPSNGGPWRSYAYDKKMYVYFDSGVTYIGDNAFAYCYCIGQVSFPDTLTEIGDYSFYQAAELQSVVLPEGLTRIGDNAFSLCGYPGLDGYDFTSVTLPSTIKSIGDGAFMMCGRLSSINLPYGLESIGKSAFASCTYLSNIEMPDSVVSLGEGAFNSCNRLKYLRFSDNIQLLPSNVFSAVEGKLKSMSEITLPLNLKTIEKNAINGKDLQTIYIPGNVESIAEGAFAGFNGTIYFSGDAPGFHEKTFQKNVMIYYPAHNESWSAVVGCDYGSSITWVSYELANCDKGHFYENGICTVCGELEKYSWQLTENIAIDISLEADLYIDLNGHNLSGIIDTNGYKIYGMDSTTNTYTCETVGRFSCMDENRNAIVPESIYTTADMMRYMSVKTEDGYTFHRFYLGITNISLNPVAVGFGYKAEFYGDEMVQSMISSVGYNLWMTEDVVINRVSKFRNSCTLLLKNFDVINYANVHVNACATITLLDGTVIKGATHSHTMQNVVESINENYTKYTESQLEAVCTMILANPAMRTWAVDNIIEE